MKNAKPLMTKNTGFCNKKRKEANTVRNTSHATDVPVLKYNSTISAIDDLTSYPTGLLFMNDPNTGQLLGCTASVINTLNGNVGITAAHCLFNSQNQSFSNIMFSNHGQDIYQHMNHID
ncbi:hypothetical protein C1645_820101 [Glomus cerebriforme]|uniref:Peptidase S1 domain-containing protein n=1 Tax=Glomus cerebriforme TaxID=658196 RepID=A0A397TDB5_9GLOM|nr:hypothetical protein C1645_820101 [Glomus cerebriforme]